MGSEGYLINQFIVSKTNKRKDKWGGTYENRIKFPIEVVKGVRETVGKGFYHYLSFINARSGRRWQQLGAGRIIS